MASPVVDRLSEQFGDSLRSVGIYDGESAELVYVRDDVEAAYKNGDIDRALSDAVLEALDQRRQESLYEHGDLQCTVRCFEEASELHFVQHQTEGFVVAIDAGELTDLRKTIADCLHIIDEE